MDTFSRFFFLILRKPALQLAVEDTDIEPSSSSPKEYNSTLTKKYLLYLRNLNLYIFFIIY